jgi:hypothetical protein
LEWPEEPATPIAAVCGEVAIQCGAMIITHNTKDFDGSARLGVSVRTPAEFLQLIREGQ